MNRYLRLAYFSLMGMSFLVLFFLLHKKGKNQEQFNTLPDFSFININGQLSFTKNLPPLSGYAIILFNPSCDICREEAQDIADNIHLFESYCLVFLSPDSLKKIEEFMLDFQLYGKDNICFGQVSLDSIDQKLGRSSIPGLFVYDSQKKLVQTSYIFTSLNLANSLSN